MRGKGRISFVLVQDLIVTSRQNRKWQGSLLADSNQTKTSTNTNQKAGTCDIRLEKKTLRILGFFFLFADFFCGHPQFFGSDIPWSLSLTTSQYREIFLLKDISIGGGSNLYLS